MTHTLRQRPIGNPSDFYSRTSYASGYQRLIPAPHVCHRDTASRLSSCCGREEYYETGRCADCKDGCGFEWVCECGELIGDAT